MQLEFTVQGQHSRSGCPGICLTTFSSTATFSLVHMRFKYDALCKTIYQGWHFVFSLSNVFSTCCWVSVAFYCQNGLRSDLRTWNFPGVVCLLTPLVLCAPILLAQTHMYTGTPTSCFEAMTWPDHFNTACSGYAVHCIPPPAFSL